MANPTVPGDDLHELRKRFDELSSSIEKLQRPSGTNISSLVSQVQQALANISATVSTAINQTSYTKTQIDDKDTSTYNSAYTNAVNAAATQAQTPSSVASTGAVSGSSLSTGGGVSGNTGTFNGGLYSTNARNFVVVSNYAASWIDVNGHFGISPSTERFKKNIEPWTNEAILDFFSITPLWYNLSIPDRYLVEVDDDGLTVIDEETGLAKLVLYPGYEEENGAAKRSGFSAEKLVDAGFSDFVVFGEDGLPVSINYAEWVVPQQMAMRYLHEQAISDRKRISDIEARLLAAGIA